MSEVPLYHTRGHARSAPALPPKGLFSCSLLLSSLELSDTQRALLKVFPRPVRLQSSVYGKCCPIPTWRIEVFQLSFVPGVSV